MYLQNRSAWFYTWNIVFLSAFTWSAIDPKDSFTWFLEVLPAIIAIVVMAITLRTFRAHHRDLYPYSDSLHYSYGRRALHLRRSAFV